jgi:putative molybdopterin biosynthesis protein
VEGTRGNRGALGAELRSRLLKAAEVAERLAMPRSEIYKLVDRGELQAIRIGRRLRFDPISVSEFIETRRGKL